MYDKTDFVTKLNPKGVRTKRYRIVCDICGEKQGYGTLSNKTNYCKRCQYNKLRSELAQPKVVYSCEVCGKEVRRNPSQATRVTKFRTCSTKCLAVARRKDISECTRAHLKKKMLQAAVEPKCVACGHDHLWNLQSHHKVFVSRGGTHDLTNLEFRCRNCHADLHMTEGEDDDE